LLDKDDVRVVALLDILVVVGRCRRFLELVKVIVSW
jgi:hypothetical protein